MLSEMLRSKSDIKLLDFFLARPGEKFSQSQIKAGISTGAVNSSLENLVKKNLINSQKIGNRLVFWLNSGNPTVCGLKQLVNPSHPAITKLKDFILENNRVAKIAVFGSYARGEDLKNSDIDVLVVGDIDEEKVQKTAMNISKKYEKTISLTIRTPEQYSEMPEKEKEFYSKIKKDEVTIYEV